MSIASMTPTAEGVSAAPRAAGVVLLQARAVDGFAGAGSWQAWNLSHERARELLSR